ncbi:Csu type fimbrial protein [Bartonella sp. LJL80]
MSNGLHMVKVKLKMTLSLVLLMGMLVIASLGFTTQKVSAASCTLSSSGGLNFGRLNLNPANTVYADATVQLYCEKGFLESNVRICLTIEPPYVAGSTETASYRLMRSTGGDTLAFSIWNTNDLNYVIGSQDKGWPNVYQQDGSGPGTIAIRVPLQARISSNVVTADQGTFRSDSILRIRYQGYGVIAPSCNNITTKIESAFPIVADVQPYCSVSASNITFTSTMALNQNLDATGGVTVYCTKNTTYSIALNQSKDATAADQRYMRNASGTDKIMYGLYRDSARVVPWGWTGSDVLTGQYGQGYNRPYTVYARIPPQKRPKSDTYTDTVTVTVTY